MNLHSIVRGHIPAVTPDLPGVWRSSAGAYVTAADGSRTPQYIDTSFRAQVQALSAKDLRHAANLNIQGVQSAVYMFGNPQGVVRTDVKGGDLLIFPQTLGGIPQTWLVLIVFETWRVEQGGWGKVGVTLQVD